MAPEILLEKRYTTDVDWWSLGVTMFELIFGKVKMFVSNLLCNFLLIALFCFLKRPFDGDTNELVKESILNDPIVMPKDVYISKECQQVIEGVTYFSNADIHRIFN